MLTASKLAAGERHEEGMRKACGLPSGKKREA